MARKYEDALRIFEKCKEKGELNKNIMRKMVVCYTQTGKIQEAAKMLLTLINEDLDFVLNTDPVKDDCPCSELVKEYESRLQISVESFDFLTSLGILWLYCDLNKSVCYFKKASEIYPDNSIVNSILSKLMSRQTLSEKELNNN